MKKRWVLRNRLLASDIYWVLSFKNLPQNNDEKKVEPKETTLPRSRLNSTLSDISFKMPEDEEQMLAYIDDGLFSTKSNLLTIMIDEVKKSNQLMDNGFL